MRPGYVVLKNIAANLTRGGATAVVALVLPHFLTRFLDTDRFAAWSLILQIAGYASFLDLGLQTAVARFTAHSIESGQQRRKEELIGTAILLLALTSALAFTVISLCIWQSPKLFDGIPYGLHPEFRQAAFLLSLSACFLLPFSTYTGVLTGMQNNELPALAIGGSRIVGALAAIVAVHVTRSLPVLALCIAVPNLIGGFVQRAAVFKLLDRCHRPWFPLFNKALAHEILRFCVGLTVNSFAMLLVGGLDLSIVGHYDFASVGFYSVAAALISFVSGLTYAGLNAMLAPITALHARGEREQIRQVLFGTTRIVVAINILLSIGVFLWGSAALRIWVGTAYSVAALPILKTLVIAQTIRLAMAAYSMMLVSVGAPEKGIPGAICEAFINLAASIAGAIWFGPMGVAAGTLIGAAGGLFWNLLRVLPRFETSRIGVGEFLRQAFLPGCIPCLPLLVFCLARNLLPAQLRVLTLLVCFVSIAWLGKKMFGRSLANSLHKPAVTMGA